MIDKSAVSDKTEDAVVDRHEDEYARHADDEGLHALLNIVLTQAWADGALLDRIQGRCELSRAQQQCQIPRLT
jgi:hypothetical protein